MPNTNFLKPLLCMILSLVILFSSMPLYAASVNDTPISDAQHEQIIRQFLEEIKEIQRQTTDISLLALNTSSLTNGQLQARINLIENNIQGLNKRIQDYLSTVPEVGERNRHVLLTFNVLNLVNGGLYLLNLLVNTTPDAERFAILEEYFYSRATARDTLEILEDILSKFNT